MRFLLLVCCALFAGSCGAPNTTASDGGDDLAGNPNDLTSSTIDLASDGPGAAVDMSLAYDLSGPTCGDGIKNGRETDVDCGGGLCRRCATGRACLADLDCSQNSCVAKACASASLSFAPAIATSFGKDHWGIGFGDFDHDGKLDIVASNPTSNTISVLLGDGKGKLGANTDVGMGKSPAGLATANLNGDGATDLAVTSSGDNKVMVALSDGKGGFVTKPYLSSGLLPQAVLLRDLDGDGKADIAVSNSTSGNVTFLAGAGSGSFATGGPMSTATGAYGLAAADFDGDGKMDLVAGNAAAQATTLGLLWGAGSGMFTPGAVMAGQLPLWPGAADFNGDGKSDLVVGSSGTGQLLVLAGTGTRNFTALPVTALGTNAQALLTADLNSDGKPDLAIAGAGPVFVLAGKGDGTFQAPLQVGLCANPKSIAAGDLDGDGRLDLAVACKGSDQIVVVLNRTP